MLARHHFQAEFAIHRRHPLEERWENPDVAMPRTEAERQAEHQQLLDGETAESRAAGMPQWEVRVKSPPITKRLRWRASFAEKGERLYGAGNSWSSGQQEGDAQELADQIRLEAPADAMVRAEHSAVYLPFTGFRSRDPAREQDVAPCGVP